jgi:phosphate-selective porin OprO and OprP
MHKRICLGICLIILASISAVTQLQAQDGFGLASANPAANQVRGPAPDGQSQLAAADQSPTGENRPPDYGALPPPPDSSNSDLARRVSDLEKQLSDYAKSATAAKSAMPTKPLIAPSGRIQFDVANFSQDATSMEQFGNAQNTVGFRRARIALLGEYETIDYIIEMDFANRGINSVVNAKDQSTGFKDVYIQMRDLPLLGNVRVGHFKECFGLEQLTSDNYTTFMERSLDDEGAFVPGRNDGIMTYNWAENQRATWAIGAFTNQTGYDQPPTFVYDHWGLDCTMRATCLPWYDEASGGRGLLHFGADYAYRSAPDHIGSFATRPESAFAPSVVNMKLTDVDDWQVGDVESALVYGPLSVQSELFASTVNRENGLTNNFYGGYVFFSYFLTGENRPYNRKMGVFDRVRPYEDFFRVRTCDDCVQTGRGAWELAYRFSYIDMLDGLTPTKAYAGAGLAADHTVGLNWYLNPYTRVMFNYVHTLDTNNTPVLDPVTGKVSGSRRIVGGNMDIFEMRFAMDF